VRCSTDAIAGGMQDVLEYRHRRALAVRAGNSDNRKRRLREVEAITHFVDAHEAKLDLAWMEGLHPRQPLMSVRVLRNGLRRAGGDRRTLHEHGQQRRELRPHLAPVDDQIDGAVFNQKLGTLEAFWQGFAHSLLDHPWAGKADQRLGSAR